MGWHFYVSTKNSSFFSTRWLITNFSPQLDLCPHCWDQSRAIWRANELNSSYLTFRCTDLTDWLENLTDWFHIWLSIGNIYWQVPIKDRSHEKDRKWSECNLAPCCMTFTTTCSHIFAPSLSHAIVRGMFLSPAQRMLFLPWTFMYNNHQKTLSSVDDGSHRHIDIDASKSHWLPFLSLSYAPLPALSFIVVFFFFVRKHWNLGQQEKHCRLRLATPTLMIVNATAAVEAASEASSPSISFGWRCSAFFSFFTLVRWRDLWVWRRYDGEKIDFFLWLLATK